MTPIRTLVETGSTNDDLAAWAAEGAAEGSWMRADVQTGGRGRSGRAWTSPTGNLYASGLVRLAPNDPAAPSLALVAAIAVAETLAAVLPDGLPATIKWPNDLLVDGAKIAGILLERHGDAVVVGIGINLADHPRGLDRPTVSVAALGGASIAPADALDVLTDSFARWLGRWRRDGLDPIRGAWLARAHPIGTALSVRQSDGAIDGLFDGLDASGALRLRRAGGEIVTIHAGDVFLI